MRSIEVLLNSFLFRGETGLVSSVSQNMAKISSVDWVMATELTVAV